MQDIFYTCIAIIDIFLLFFAFYRLKLENNLTNYLRFEYIA